MKIEADTTKPFKQIEVKFTIESELELKYLNKMVRFNISIPELVDEDGKEGKLIIENFLNNLRYKLNNFLVL